MSKNSDIAFAPNADSPLIIFDFDLVLKSITPMEFFEEYIKLH